MVLDTRRGKSELVYYLKLDLTGSLTAESYLGLISVFLISPRAIQRIGAVAKV